MISALQRLYARHGRNVFAVFGSRALIMLFMAGGTRLLTELFPVETFGKFKLLEGCVMLCYGLLPQRFAQFVQRTAHDADHGGAGPAFDDFARKITRKSSFAIGLVSALVLAGTHLLYGSPAWLGCIMVPFLLVALSSHEIERTLLQTRNRQVESGIIEVIRAAAVPALAAIGVTLLTPAAWIPLFTGAIVLVVLDLTVRTRHPIPAQSKKAKQAAHVAQEKQWLREAVLFIGPLLPLGLLSWIVNLGDRYLLAGLSSTADAGRYTAIYSLVMMPLMTLSGIGGLIISPVWFKRSAAGDRRGARQARGYLLLYVACAGILGVGAFAVLGEFAASLILAEEYRQHALGTMLWLAGGAAFLSFGNAMEFDALAKKRTGRITVSYTAAAVVNIVCNLYWIPIYRTHGAAMATCAAFAAFCIASTMFSMSGSAEAAAPSAR